MPINCVTNALQDIADNLQDGLNQQINNLTDAGKAGLAALENKAELALAGIKNAIPELPQLDNFKTELAAILAVPDQLEQKLGELADKWGSAIPDLDDILSKITSIDFDFCSMVPNVDLDADGNPIVKDSESKITTEPPPAVATLKKEEKAVDNSKTAKGNTTAHIDQYNKNREKIRNNEDLKYIEDQIKLVREEIATVGEGDFDESAMDSVLRSKRLNPQVKSKAGLNRLSSVLDNFSGGGFLNYKAYDFYSGQEKAAIDVLVARTYMHTALTTIQSNVNKIKECVILGSVTTTSELEQFIKNRFEIQLGERVPKYRGLPVIWKKFGDSSLAGWTYRQASRDVERFPGFEPKYALVVVDENKGSLESLLTKAYTDLFEETKVNAAYVNNDEKVDITPPEVSAEDEETSDATESTAGEGSSTVTPDLGRASTGEAPVPETDVSAFTAPTTQTIPVATPSTPSTGGGGYSAGGGGGGGSSGGGGGGY